MSPGAAGRARSPMPIVSRRRSRLDIAATGWTPTVDNFLGRVTKARIVQAVREAKGADAARRIEALKKGDMAREAEQLLAGTDWLPEPLRTPGPCARMFRRKRLPILSAPEDAAAIEETAAIGRKRPSTKSSSESR